MTQILKGRPARDRLLSQLEKECAALLKDQVKPCLGVFRIGEKADDLSYERGIVKTMARIGMAVETVSLPADVSKKEAAAVFRRLCEKEETDGILPLMPLPERFRGLISLIPPEKDVDGLRGEESAFPPCTPHGVMEFLDYYEIGVKDKNVAVLGRSPLVGKPLAALLEGRGAIVSVVHSRTEHPSEVIRRAEIVFSAVGKARFLDENRLGPHQTVLDIGVNEDPLNEGRICGDLNEKAAQRLDLRYSPVPGGVGEMTTAVLAEHTLRSCIRRRCAHGEVSLETK
ncbi:MAG: bifunctional 5,10-methylenetetrahydrofolate dehydrogenase/5,10-methenyltetrahydrofolate cyclohydrolase [Clostridia bacterium]